jgi:hypothetical protein
MAEGRTIDNYRGPAGATSPAPAAGVPNIQGLPGVNP